MKKVILLILLCAVMLTLKATGQSGDVIRLEGEEWVFDGKAYRIRLPAMQADGSFSSGKCQSVYGQL